MIQYRRLKRDLINVNTRFVDSERNSTNFFNITSMPDSFTSGKNSFKIKPNFTNLSQNYPIYIEVLDAKGYNIFHHVTDSEEADGSRIVAVYVYPTTNLGDCTVTFIGTSKVDLNKNPLDRTSIVENNIKYVHRMGVDSFKVNDNDIIFDKEPTIEISEKKYSIIEDKFSSNTKSTTKTGTVRYSLEDGVPKVFALDETFNSSYLNSTISFPYLSDNYQPLFSFQTSSFEFSASVVSVDGNYSMTLDTKLSVQGTANEVVDITTSDNQSYFLRYNTEPTKKNITQNIKNYAKIDLNELDPIVGNVTRVKIFSKSKTDPASEYKSIYDSKIETKNLLTDYNSDIMDFDFGIFKLPIVKTKAGLQTVDSINPLDYWSVYSVNGAPTPAKNLYTSDIFTGMEATIPLGSMSGNQEILIQQSINAKTDFYKDTIYELKFDTFRYVPSNDKRNPKLEVYVSGTAFIGDGEFGKYIGEVELQNTTNYLSMNNLFGINPDNDGNGILKFIVRPGVVLQNISVSEKVEPGFTPKRLSLYVPLQQNHKLEYMDFKVQYFNDSLKESNVQTTANDLFFEGGNTYIYGNDNVITGSTFLSPYTSSGMQLTANINPSGVSSGSAIQPYLYQGVQNAIDNPNTSTNFGWALNTGNPYNLAVGSFSQNSINMINECGSIFNFGTTPSNFELFVIGPSSEFLLGWSGSYNPVFGTAGTSGGAACSAGTCGESYIKWDGCKIVIQNAIVNGSTSGGGGTGGLSGTSGTSGTSGISGANGTSGTSGANGVNGANGTSGANGANGTSGTSGANGADGTAGTSGVNGVNGTSGTSGINGTSGVSMPGIPGTSGTSGANGGAGTSGTSGTTVTYKSGTVAAASFSGSPYSYSLTFATPFSNNNYAVSIIGGDTFSWSISSKSANGFTIDTNSFTPPSYDAYWTAIVFNDP